MRLDVRDPKDKNEAFKTGILDIDSGRFLKGIIAADDATGQVIKYKIIDGKRVMDPQGEALIYSDYHNFEFVRVYK